MTTTKQRAAGVVIVRSTPAGWRCLVLRAFRNWDFPKGLVDPDESARAAALREVREETSLEGLCFRWGDEFRETDPYSRGKTARYYVAEQATGEVMLPVSRELGRPEHHEYRWTSFDEALQLLPARLHRIVEWARSLVEGSSSPTVRPTSRS